MYTLAIDNYTNCGVGHISLSNSTVKENELSYGIRH